MHIKNFFLIPSIILTVFVLSGYTYSPEKLAKSGDFAFSQKDYLRAVDYYKGLILQQPDNMSAYNSLGLAYLGGKDYDRAIDNFNKAIESNNSTNSLKGDTYFNNCKAHWYNGQYEKALNSCKKANEIKPGTDLQNVDFYVELYENTDQIKKAIDLQKRYNPSDNLAKHYNKLSHLYIKDHNYNEASLMAIKAIESNPDNGEGYYLAGVASGKKNQYDKAIDTIRKAIQINSSQNSSVYDYYAVLAYYMTKNGQYDEALSAYNNAIQSPNNSSANINDTVQSLYLYNIGRYDEALSMTNNLINSMERGQVGIYFEDYISGSFGLNSTDKIILQAKNSEVPLISKILVVSLSIPLQTLCLPGMGCLIEYNKNFNGDYYIFDTKTNSPAEKAGLCFGDKIIAINGVQSERWDKDKLIKNLTGDQGTKVTLKIRRDSQIAQNAYKNKPKKEIFNVTLTREQLLTPKQSSVLADAYGIRSLIQRAKGDYKSAYTDADKAYSIYPESVNTKLAYGLSKVDRAEYRKALDILSEIQPEMVENKFSRSNEDQLNIGKAIAYAKLGNYNNAIGIVPEINTISKFPPAENDSRKLVQLYNQISEIHAQKAIDLEKKGFVKEALNEYTIALSLSSDDKRSKTIKSNLFNLVHNMPYPLTLPEEARSHLVRGTFLIQQNDLQGVLREFKMALKIAPYMSGLYKNVAVAYAHLKNYGEAISYMNDYTELEPNAPGIQEAKDDIIKWQLLLERK